MLKRFMCVVMLTLMVSGCSWLGGAKPESVNQSFYLAYALVQSGYESIEIAIHGGQITTQSQARKLKEPLDEAKAALDVAKAAFDVGGDFDEGVFDNTQSVLVALQQTLLTLGAETEASTVLPFHEWHAAGVRL